MEYNQQIFRYNCINIISICTLVIIQVFNFTFWIGPYAAMSDIQAAAGLFIFWPIIFLLFLIRRNRTIIRKYIHFKNQLMYQTHNVEFNEGSDNDEQLMAQVRENLPTSSRQVVSGFGTEVLFDGKFEDLQISYSVRRLGYNLTEEGIKSFRYMYNLNSTAIILHTNIQFGNQPTLYTNEHVIITDAKYQQEISEPVNQLKPQSKLHYSSNTTTQQIANIKAVVEHSFATFDQTKQIMILFKDNKIIYIIEETDQLKFKLPMLITRSKFDAIVNNRKTDAYRLNQLMVSLSRVVNEVSNEQ